MTEHTVRFSQLRYTRTADQAIKNTTAEFRDEHPDAEITSLRCNATKEDKKGDFNVTITADK